MKTKIGKIISPEKNPGYIKYFYLFLDLFFVCSSFNYSIRLYLVYYSIKNEESWFAHLRLFINNLPLYQWI